MSWFDKNHFSVIKISHSFRVCACIHLHFFLFLFCGSHEFLSVDFYDLVMDLHTRNFIRHDKWMAISIDGMNSTYKFFACCIKMKNERTKDDFIFFFCSRDLTRCDATFLTKMNFSFLFFGSCKIFFMLLKSYFLLLVFK